MTDEQLDAIRARLDTYDHANRMGWAMPDAMTDYVGDTAALLAEVERLREKHTDVPPLTPKPPYAVRPPTTR